MDKINLRTLVDAAKFVESKDCGQTGDHGFGYLPLSPATNALFQPDRENVDDDQRSTRRRPEAGIRENHNKLEKNRRAHLKECFELLKKQIPTGEGDRKFSNLEILHNAIRYLHIMHKKEVAYEHEMEILAREKIALQKRYAKLRKELCDQWDHTDFNKFTTDETTVSDVAVSPDRPIEEMPFRKDFYWMHARDQLSVDHRNVLMYASSPPQYDLIPNANNESALSVLSAVVGLAEKDKGEVTQRKRHFYENDSEPCTGHKPATTPLESLPHSDDRDTQNQYTAGNDFSHNPIPSDNRKSISCTSRLESFNPHGKASSYHLQLPIISTSSAGHIASATLQLELPKILREDQSFPQRLPEDTNQQCDRPSVNAPVLQKSEERRAPVPAYKNNEENCHLALTARNGTILPHPTQLVGGSNPIRANLAPHPALGTDSLDTAHETLFRPTSVPLTVVYKGDQVTHFLTAARGKVVTPLNITPVMPHYLVDPGAAMVVVSQNSQVSQAPSK